MLSFDIIALLKDWVLPVGSLVLSIWFAASAKRDAESADAILKRVNDAVEGWQEKIMSSTVNILESLPQVVHGKAALARVDAAKALTEGIQSAIHEIAKNPQPGAVGHTQEQNLKTLVSQLNELLTKMSGAPNS